MTQATWIFQANPNKYNIQKSLRTEDRELWGCNQHAKEIKRGDRVLIWLSGPKAGIYAVGETVSDVVAKPDSQIGLSYWTNLLDGLERRDRVLVEYTQKLIDRPLSRQFLRWDPALWELSIFKQAQGTNFRVTNSEWEAIKEFLDRA
jgi:hypothetical protein